MFLICTLQGILYPYYTIFIEKKGKFYLLNGYIMSEKKASQRTQSPEILLVKHRYSFFALEL